jgi:hypothetical protein
VKLSRRRGRLRLHLGPAEATLLGSLFDELEAVLAGELAADDPVLRRLYPSAYPDDDEADAEYRSLTEQGLRDARLERLAACRAELAAGPDVELADPDAARRWIQVLNDLRLALGTRLGVSEDDSHEVDPTDPQARPRVIYYWLTAVQDSVVSGLLR